MPDTPETRLNRTLSVYGFGRGLTFVPDGRLIVYVSATLSETFFRSFVLFSCLFFVVGSTTELLAGGSGLFAHSVVAVQPGPSVVTVTVYPSPAVNPVKCTSGFC